MSPRTQRDWCSTVLHRVPAVGAFEVKESTVNDNAFMTKKRYFEGCDAASQRMITGLPVKCTHAKCRYGWPYVRKGMCSHGSATWAGITQLGRSLLLGCWTSLLVKYFFLFLYWGPFYARCVNYLRQFPQEFFSATSEFIHSVVLIFKWSSLWMPKRSISKFCIYLKETDNGNLQV